MAANDGDLFALKPTDQFSDTSERTVHVLGKGIICTTEHRARRRSPLQIVVDATEGFIPLWANDLVLRWRFNDASLAPFRSPNEIKTKIRQLLTKAIAAWGDGAPIRFTENSDNSDFEIMVEKNDDCSPQGCTLAQAFFPDAGRHPLYVFPKMFGQIEKEQVDTLTHEIGHVFGLRHFFAPDSETRWPSVIFGDHKPFSIMNYGQNSELTEADRDDLKKLYAGAWNGQLTQINGTPIKLVWPYHYRHV
jgi:hypothetical protein